MHLFMYMLRVPLTRFEKLSKFFSIFILFHQENVRVVFAAVEDTLVNRNLAELL